MAEWMAPEARDALIVEDVDLAADEVIVDGERPTDERAEAIAADVLERVCASNALFGVPD